MKAIAVAGGKGGTGKTFVAVNLARLLSSRDKTLLVDADVENPSTLFALPAEVKEVKQVESFKPLIDEAKCSKCGLCVKNCPEHALVMLVDKRILYFEDLCCGCEVCKLVCPSSAVNRGLRVEGLFKYGSYGESLDVVVGELKPGIRRSGFMITRLIEEHRGLFEKYSYVVVDSPPGSGVGLLSVVKEADVVVAVSEPTPLGLNDLKKFLTLLERVEKRLKVILVVNKHGLPGGLERDLEEEASKRGLPVIAIPYSELVVKSYVERRPIVDLHPESQVSKGLVEVAKLVSS